MADQHSQQSFKKAPFSVFIASTIVVFFLSLSAADSIGLVPDYIDGSTPVITGGGDIASADSVALADLPQLGVSDQAPAGASAPTSATVHAAFPLHITISSVGIDLPVQNPKTVDVDTLDALLQRGPARYADSALLGEKGTMIIFAHSSHLPIVHNKMFQAFNDIPNAQAGDTVAVEGSDGKEYIYGVNSVVKASTNDGTSINISPSAGTRLVLVTCDTLTGKSARYILTADYIGMD